MNKNQLLKALSRNMSAYENLAQYQSVLKEAKMIKLSLSHIKNMDSMIRQFDEISKSKAIKFPFDNVFIDLHSYQMPSMLTGENEVQNMGIHLIPMTFDMKGISIMSLLVLDFRKYGQDVIYRTYLIYCDLGGLHIMPNVDKASKECQCYMRNVFWMNPNFRSQISEKTLCHTNDNGLALPECAANTPACQQTVCQKTDIADLIRVLLGYMTLPTNHIFKVMDTEKKKSSEYFILADSKQIDLLMSGEIQAETVGNGFVDGSRLKDAVEGEQEDPPHKRFKVNGRIYEYYSKDEDGK